MPDLAPDDQKHLLETDWRTRPMDEKAGELALRFDQTFRLLRDAAASKAPCDWGVDMSRGPEALLPHLAKAKRCALTAVLRARWFVQQGKPDAARDDLVAAFVLGRNVSQDGTLISALVQIAMESIITVHVVQQWPELQTDTIRSILIGIDNAPPRGTMANCMQIERVGFYDWLIRRIHEIQAKYPANEQKALQEISKLLDGAISEEGQQHPGFGASVIQAAGNSISGLLEYVGQLDPLYREMEQVMALPYAEFQPALQQLQQKISGSPNLLAHEFLPAVSKVRLREFRILARLAMVQAAYQFRLDPANGLRSVPDPYGNGPFDYSRFVLDGIDRGFKLKSALLTPDFTEVLIFAEKSGAAFRVDGPNAGEKVQ